MALHSLHQNENESNNETNGLFFFCLLKQNQQEQPAFELAQLVTKHIQNTLACLQPIIRNGLFFAFSLSLSLSVRPALNMIPLISTVYGIYVCVGVWFSGKTHDRRSLSFFVGFLFIFIANSRWERLNSSFGILFHVHHAYLIYW